MAGGRHLHGIGGAAAGARWRQPGGQRERGLQSQPGGKRACVRKRRYVDDISHRHGQRHVHERRRAVGGRGHVAVAGRWQLGADERESGRRCHHQLRRWVTRAGRGYRPDGRGGGAGHRR